MVAELDAAAGREPHVRYHVARYHEKWAIARQSVRTYWGWDEFITRGFELREAAGIAAAKREDLDMPVHHSTCCKVLGMRWNNAGCCYDMETSFIETARTRAQSY